MISLSSEPTAAEKAESDQALEQQRKAGNPDACLYDSRDENKEWAAFSRSQLTKLCEAGNTTACAYAKSLQSK